MMIIKQGVSMPNYRAIVNYQFKSGMENKGMTFLQNELVKKAQSMGCHNIELCQSETDHCHVVGIATWNSIDEARDFQAVWQTKEHELAKLCAVAPKREFFIIAATFAEKARRAA